MQLSFYCGYNFFDLGGHWLVQMHSSQALEGSRVCWISVSNKTLPYAAQHEVCLITTMRHFQKKLSHILAPLIRNQDHAKLNAVKLLGNQYLQDRF